MVPLHISHQNHPERKVRKMQEVNGSKLKIPPLDMAVEASDHLVAVEVVTKAVKKPRVKSLPKRSKRRKQRKRKKKRSHPKKRRQN